MTLHNKMIIMRLIHFQITMLYGKQHAICTYQTILKVHCTSFVNLHVPEKMYGIKFKSNCDHFRLQDAVVD